MKSKKIINMIGEMEQYLGELILESFDSIRQVLKKCVPLSDFFLAMLTYIGKILNSPLMILQ